MKQNSKPKVFQEFQPKIKKHAEQFPSPSEQTQTAKNPTKDQQEKHRFLFPQQKNPQKCYPPGNVGIQKLLKTHLPRRLPWQQPRLVVVEALGLEDQNLRLFFWGTPQGIGWWFCRLKKTFKTSPFPGVSPSFFGALPRLFVFFKWASWKKNMRTISPSGLYMIWKQAFCKDHFKKIEGFKFKKTECRMNCRILRGHIEYFINHLKSQHFKRHTHIFPTLAATFFGSIKGKDPKKPKSIANQPCFKPGNSATPSEGHLTRVSRQLGKPPTCRRTRCCLCSHTTGCLSTFSTWGRRVANSAVAFVC